MVDSKDVEGWRERQKKSHAGLRKTKSELLADRGLGKDLP